MKIKHKFINHKIDINTTILIVGTFNPDVIGNDAEFFYGRKRNFLWTLLPKVFNESSLKDCDNKAKLCFMKKHKIDFADLILEIDVESGEENNYSDDYIDGRVIKWKNIIEDIFKKHRIQKVYFTRKTFSNIPNIKKRIFEIKEYCNNHNIKFNFLVTPARLENKAKLDEWKKAFGR
jgi:G:T/U-mismatch repair DNA glycosylase